MTSTKLSFLILIVLTILLLGTLGYLVYNIHLLKTDPCNLCQNITGKLCMDVGSWQQ